MSSKRLLIVGDIMLDVNQDGAVTRVSPEGPVVILKNPVATKVLGGAANTAANVRSLGAEVVLVGAVGLDQAGDESSQLLAGDGIEDGLVHIDGYRTTVKTRFLARGQHIMRLDEEDPVVPSIGLRRLLSNAQDLLDNVDALVLSDYDKGVITKEAAQTLVAGARSRNLPVIVDSKKLDMNVFRGATVVTPNEMEAVRCAGVSDVSRAAHVLSEQTQGSVLVTRGARGMLLLEDGRETGIPAEGQEVADVVGAGDTVTAAVAVALAEGTLDLLGAARWANRAAAVAVRHAGTYAVRRDDFD